MAIEQDAYGEAFNITDGEATPCREYFTQLAKIADLAPPFSLPANILKSIVGLRCFYQSLLKQTPDILPESIAYLNRPYGYSIVKAQNQLGYHPQIGLEEGMKLTQQWLQESK